MPKGVEHRDNSNDTHTASLACRSQRCRKALSTSRLRTWRRWRRTVPKSEMPKGVEHAPALGRDQAMIQVPKSEMPKGVEHQSVCRTYRQFGPVPKSEMPKGVEHPDGWLYKPRWVNV